MRELITAADANGQNIFHWAASVGCKYTFAAVLEVLDSRLTHDEVRAACFKLDKFRRFVPNLHLSCLAPPRAGLAMWSCCFAELTWVVANAHAQHLLLRNNCQVKNLVSASTAATADDIFSESRTVLNSAASSGSEEVFTAVLAELERIWPAWRVRYVTGTR